MKNNIYRAILVILPITISFIFVTGYKAKEINIAVSSIPKIEEISDDVKILGENQSMIKKNYKYLTKKNLEHDKKIDILIQSNKQNERMYEKIEHLYRNIDVIKNDIDWIKRKLEKK